MKKFFLSVICILTAIILTSCGNNNPSYWEAWDYIEGYMILDEGENVTTRHFEPYDISIKDTSHRADMYVHSYSRNPETTFEVSEWDEQNIKYDVKSTNRFTISNKPKELNGFIFYKDSDNIYVINTLYNCEDRNLKLKEHPDKYTSADYRFIIDVSGIYDDVEIYMDDRKKWD